MLQVLAPVLTVSAMAAPAPYTWANPLNDAQICTAHGLDEAPVAPLSHHDGSCPVCAFCAAVQLALTPAAVAPPVPRVCSGLAWLQGFSIACHKPQSVPANARSPPAIAL